MAAKHVGMRERARIAESLQRELVGVNAARRIDREDELEINALGPRPTPQGNDTDHEHHPTPGHVLPSPRK